jgi:hypothetical protein
VQSVSAMLDNVCAAQQAGLFHRLLNDGMYQNYCRALNDHSTAQASLSVQSILVSDGAMAGIEQAALALQLFLTAASRQTRIHFASFSDALASRDALLGAVNKASRLSPPWKTMIGTVIGSQWDRSYHAIVAIACKVDPRRRFAELPGTMEADAQRLRDKLISHLEPAQRKLVIDSWVRMLKREDCFGDVYALENAHEQSPLDWWIAHTAAHRELREFVVFPALAALGVSLAGNNTHAHYDPAHNTSNLENDATAAIRAMELSEDILRNPDAVDKLAYIRRNCWSLHNARKELRISSKRQFALMSPADLLPAEFPIIENQEESASDQGSGAGSSGYSAVAEYGYPHDAADRAPSASLPSNHVFGDQHEHYMPHHGESATLQHDADPDVDSGSRGRGHLY